MLNMVALAEDVTDASGNQTAVAFGPSGSSDPAKRMYPGETVVIALVTSDAYDGAVHVEYSDDGGSTYTDLFSAIDLTTGKNKFVQGVLHEHMRLVVDSRSAGSVGAYILNGS